MSIEDQIKNASENYEAKGICSNCRNVESARIPKGTTINDYFSSMTCSKCGCKTMYKYDSLTSSAFKQRLSEMASERNYYK